MALTSMPSARMFRYEDAIRVAFDGINFLVYME